MVKPPKTKEQQHAAEEQKQFEGRHVAGHTLVGVSLPPVGPRQEELQLDELQQNALFHSCTWFSNLLETHIFDAVDVRHTLFCCGKSKQDTMSFSLASISASAGVQPTSLAVQAAHSRALATTNILAARAGGEGTGNAILANTAAGISAEPCAQRDVGSTIACLQAQARQACYVDRNPEACATANRLLGHASAQHIQMAIDNRRYSPIEQYFLRPTYVSTPQYSAPDVAALAVAANSTSR